MICPKCKEKIDSLRQVSTGTEECEMFFNKKENWIDWKNEEFKSDGIVRIFYCPKCNEELDLNDEEAEEMLKERDELKELVVEKLNKIKEKNDMP